MTVHQPLYRLTVYSPRSVDPDEVTPLVPRAGALHSNPFRVATRDHGRAVRIGATTSRYLIRNPVGTWPTTELSVEYWGRLDAGLSTSQPNWGFTYSRQTVQFNEILCGIQVNGGNWRQSLAVDNVGVEDADNYPNDNKYHHLGWRWRSSDGAWAMLLDGVVVASGAGLKTGYSIAAGGIVVLGQEQDAAGGGFDTTQAWKGELDETRVYTRFLSDAEFKQHAGGIYIDETGLCARWGFDLDGVPALGYDSSSAANHLTPVGIDAGTPDTALHFYPYLREPEIPAGRFNPLKRTLQTRTCNIGLIDVALDPTSNLKRHITQYLGDAKFRNQLLGLIARLEESLNDGFTWSAAFTGRIDLTQLEEMNAYSAPLVDIVDELSSADVFVGRPHSSVAYAVAPQVWPVGPATAYGAIPASLPIKGKIQNATGFAASAGIKAIVVDTNELSNPRNRLTPTLEEVSGSWATAFPGLLGDIIGSFFPEGVTYSSRARVKLKRLDTLAQGQFQLGVVRRGSAPPSGLAAIGPLGGLGFGNAIAEVVLAELPNTDPNYLAMPAVTTAVECSVILVDEDPDEDAPLLIGDVHRVTFLKDMVRGHFGRMKLDGTPVRSFAFDATSFAQLEADQSIGTVRRKVDKRARLREDAEKHLLRDGNLGWRVDGHGQVVVFSTKRPSSLAGIGTITDADLVQESGAFKWKQGRTGAITAIEAHWYVDLPIGPDGSAIAPSKLAVSPTLLMRTVKNTLLIRDFGREDMGDERETIDAVGMRAMPGEIVQKQSRAVFIRRQLERTLEELRMPHGTGPAEAELRCRRTTEPNTWQPGQFKIVDVDAMPDPATNLRGGARLMMCIDRKPRRETIEFVALDMGPNAIAAAPTSATLATDTDDTAHGFSLAVTLNGAGDPVILEYALTDSGVGVRPVESDPAWTFARRITTTGTYKVINLPAGKKVWPRHRSVPASETNSQLPSVWSFPTGGDNVTLATLTAPSALGTAELTGKRVVITFTPGDTRLPTEVLLATPTTDPRVRVKTAPPGATRVELTDLTVSTTYRCGLQHRDALGGFSTEATVDFTTTATPATAPNPGGFELVIGVP